MSKFRVSSRALRDLGWSHVVDAWAERCRTGRGKEIAGQAAFLSSIGAAEKTFERTEEVRSLFQEEETIPLDEAEDVRDALSRADKGAILLPQELLDCAKLARASSRTLRFLRAHAERCPQLGAMTDGLPNLGPLASRIEEVFEPSGALRDDASEALAEYRAKSRTLHRQLKERMESILHDPAFEHRLQDSYYSVRNDRYVLPIITSFRSQVPGIVHNASQSGQTIFVEPQEIVGMGNELAIAESLAKEEEQRILAELSGDVAERGEAMQEALQRLGELDTLQAAARLAEDLNATAPKVLRSGQPWSLRDARHPILVLQGKRVIPNDLSLDDGQRAVIVSGPNAGGKTVTLTTLGLCALMVRAGLCLPVGTGSAMPWVEGVASSLGDAQNLAEDLSTFTARVRDLVEILGVAAEGWLCLLDEIASGTDPREGAALAVSVLRTLVEGGARLVATTHSDEVKALGLTDSRFENARVGLDPVNLRPTFRVERGTAGVSNAFEIAERAGLPSAIVTAARNALEEGGSLGKALDELQRAQQEAEKAKAELERERGGLREARADVERTQEELRTERRELEVQVRAELSEELGELRERARAMVAELQKHGDMRQAQKAQKELEAAQQTANASRDRAAGVGEAERRSDATPDVPLKEGMTVHVPSLGRDGQIVSIDGEDVTVVVGSLRTRQKKGALVAVRSATKGATKSQGPKPPDHSAATERLDIRGSRVDDALERLDAALDACYFNGTERLHVVHGHGTGALKRAVREALLASPYVESSEPAPRKEGGDGVTIVSLREQ